MSVCSSPICCTEGPVLITRFHWLTLQSFRQYPLYSKTKPPVVLKEHFKDDTFKKSQEYGKDKAKFSLCNGLFKQALDSVLLHYGVYAWSWGVAGGIRSTLGYGPEYEVSWLIWLMRNVTDPSSLHRSFSHSSSPLFYFSSPLSQTSQSPLIKRLSSRKSTGLTRRPRGCSLWIPSKACWSDSRSVLHSLPRS